MQKREVKGRNMQVIEDKGNVRKAKRREESKRVKRGEKERREKPSEEKRK